MSADGSRRGGRYWWLMPNSSYWPESKGARAGDGAHGATIVEVREPVSGFEFLLCSPGDGRVRAHIQARGGGLPVVSPA